MGECRWDGDEEDDVVQEKELYQSDRNRSTYTETDKPVRVVVVRMKFRIFW